MRSRGKREEGRGKREEGRGKREEGRGKRGQCLRGLCEESHSKTTDVICQPARLILPAQGGAEATLRRNPGIP
jgi:hypothetical protein